MSKRSQPPDRDRRTVKKILNELNKLSDEATACGMVFTILLVLQTEFYSDGDDHAAALKLAAMFADYAARNEPAPN